MQHVLATTHAIDRGFTARFDREPAVVVVAGDAVLVAGFFRTVNGQPRAGLAALDAATGALRAWNPAPDGPVRALAAGGDGTVYAAGEFGHIGGAARSGLAQLSLASGAATAWNPAPATVTGTPWALAVTPSAVVMGGGFLWFVDKREMSRLVAVDRASGAATALGPTDSIGLFASDGEVSAVAVAGGTVYAGGSFATVGGQPRRGVAAFDLASGHLLPFAAANDGDVTSLVASPDGLIVSGDHLRKLDLATGAALPFSPVAGPGKLTVLGDAIVLAETSQTVGVGKAGGLAAIGPDGRPRASFTPPAGLEYGRALLAGDALFALGCPSRGCASGATGIRQRAAATRPADGREAELAGARGVAAGRAEALRLVDPRHGRRPAHPRGADPPLRARQRRAVVLGDRVVRREHRAACSGWRCSGRRERRCSPPPSRAAVPGSSSAASRTSAGARSCASTRAA